MEKINLNKVLYMLRPARKEDGPDWHRLWRSYCAFYKVDLPDEVSSDTWKRILNPAQQIHCLVMVNNDDRVVAFANYVLHPYTWSSQLSCYLEDLFVEPDVRGQGLAMQLIEELLRLCKQNHWTRLYWHTNSDNSTARRVYDRFCPADDYVRYTVHL